MARRGAEQVGYHRIGPDVHDVIAPRPGLKVFVNIQVVEMGLKLGEAGGGDAAVPQVARLQCVVRRIVLPIVEIVAQSQFHLRGPLGWSWWALLLLLKICSHCCSRGQRGRRFGRQLAPGVATRELGLQGIRRCRKRVPRWQLGTQRLAQGPLVGGPRGRGRWDRSAIHFRVESLVLALVGDVAARGRR